MIFAKAGERVQDPASGHTICIVKRDLDSGDCVSAADFHEFVEGEERWRRNERVDRRCCRPNPSGRGLQIYIEDEWRP